MARGLSANVKTELATGNINPVYLVHLGFATPISLIAGFLFGKVYGTLISVFGFTIGCTLLYILANQYFKDLILRR